MDKNPQIRECSSAEYTEALDKLGVHPVHFLQAPYYGKWQAKDGKTVVFFAAQNGGDVVAAGLAVKYDAPGGISFFYCPYGPVVREWTPELYAALRQFFAPIAAQSGATFVRFDVYPDGVQPASNKLAKTASLQPRAEWLLDISGNEEDIWIGFHKHARYNVRLAERAHAKLEFFEPTKAPLGTFVSLMKTTSARDNFGLNTEAYYSAVMQSIPADNGFVALVTIDDKPAAVALFAAYDGTMHYVFAGSSNEFRKIAPPYFLIWNAIQEAKKRGWTVLNFGGISEAVKGTHLAGVTAFKKRFGGYEQTHPNPTDLIYKPVRYSFFKLYKALK